MVAAHQETLMLRCITFDAQFISILSWNTTTIWTQIIKVMRHNVDRFWCVNRLQNAVGNRQIRTLQFVCIYILAYITKLTSVRTYSEYDSCDTVLTSLRCQLKNLPAETVVDVAVDGIVDVFFLAATVCDCIQHKYTCIYSYSGTLDDGVRHSPNTIRPNAH